VTKELVVEFRNRTISLGGSVYCIYVGRFIEMNMIITFMPMDTSKDHPWLEGSPLEFHIPPFFRISGINFYLVLFVELTVTERVRVTDRVIVALLLGDLVRLSVTLAVLVNGRVVGIPDLLTVRVTERVILTDTVLDTVTDPERVGKLDAGTV
jgi:hypothetical protein